MQNFVNGKGELLKFVDHFVPGPSLWCDVKDEVKINP
jgi:hypothetical protein